MRCVVMVTREWYYKFGHFMGFVENAECNQTYPIILAHHCTNTHDQILTAILEG